MAGMVMILGAGRMQIPAIEAARRLGLDSLVVDGNPQAIGRRLADRFFTVDLTDLAGLLRCANRYRDELRGVFTVGTDFSTSVAYVAEHCDLPGIPYRVALNASDKLRMRRCFAAAGTPSPRYASSDDAADYGKLSLPLVVKPVDSMGARGVRRVSTYNELSAALAAAAAISRSGRALVEEYIDGPEYSLDAIVYRGHIEICGIAERHIRYAPWFVEVGHTIPASLSAYESRELEGVFRAAIRALGIENGAAKGDIFLTPRGAVVGEVAARLSGGFMSGWSYPRASGVDLTAAALRIAIGAAPGSLAPGLNRISAERALISIPGIVARIEGEEEVSARPQIEACFLHVAVGQRVVFPRNNVEKCANVIATAADRGQAIAAAEAALEGLRIYLRAGDQETLAFLYGNENQHTPHAFELRCEANQQALLLMPKGIHAPFGRSSNSYYSRTAIWRIAALPQLRYESQRDWNMRTLEETVAMLRRRYRLEFVSSDPTIGRCFWHALLKGGLQGGCFFFDTLKEGHISMREWIARWEADD